MVPVLMLLYTINETPFDVVIGINKSFKLEAVSELLIKYGVQKILQSQKQIKIKVLITNV